MVYKNKSPLGEQIYVGHVKEARQNLEQILANVEHVVVQDFKLYGKGHLWSNKFVVIVTDKVQLLGIHVILVVAKVLLTLMSLKQ